MPANTNRSTLSWDDVRYFVEVAQVGTITRAAERLGIRQPSLSAAMQRLEKRLGCELLIRSKSGVELTREGKLLAARGRTFLSEWEQLESHVTRQSDEPAGRITIGAHISVASHWLPKTLPSMLAKWPKLEVSVVHDLSRRVNDLIVSHQLDFGIVVNPLRHPDLVISELATDVFSVWGKTRGFAATVLYDPDLQQAQTILRQLEQRGVHFQRSLTSSSFEVLVRLAAEGAGTAILPAHLAEQTRYRLRQPMKDPPRVRDSICLVYRADAQRTPAARALVQALRAARPM